VDVSLRELEDALDAEQRVGSPAPAPGADSLVGFGWLERLRWGAATGQATVIAFAWIVLGEPMPWLGLVALVVVTLATNGALAARPGFRPPWLMPAVLALDVMTLALMMAISGGPSNPFTIFFLVHVALAAMLLPPRLVWCIVALTVASYGMLFLLPATSLSLHAVGMGVAYALAAAFVAHFVGKVALAIRERDLRLAVAADLAHQNEKLAALSAFSANAAHELGTPLGVIALASKELLRAAPLGTTSEVEADARLIHAETMKCRAILASIAARAGESVGEMFVAVRLGELTAELAQTTLGAPTIVFDPPELEARSVEVPRHTLVQMLANLVRNGADAQRDAGHLDPVRLTVRERAGIVFAVADRGAGVAEAVRARLGEPFVSTKIGHGGLGLGVYLARSFAERLGGSLTYATNPDGRGTVAELRIPFAAARGPK